MIKKIGIYCVCLASLGLAATSCNGDPLETSMSLDYSSTQVKTFSLKANKKVLNNLDSVYFSIDLVNGRIFNADSLPFGTKINRLQVDLTTDNCSVVELHFPRAGRNDSIVDFLTNSTDSIDFSNGPVTLHVVSYDKIASRDYKISVNVHNTIADSLYWDLNKPYSLPTSLSAPIAQSTVIYNNKYLTLTADDSGNTALASSAHPAEQGESHLLSLPFKPVIESFTATNSALFILGIDGILYTSGDGSAWTSTGQTWKSITAPYGNTLVGVAENNGSLFHVTYPATTTSPVKADFPVKGNSQIVRYASDWGQKAQVITVGGLRADGVPTPSVWAYDGSAWACLNNSTPMAAEGITVAPYYCCQTDTNTWISTTRSVLLAMGGRTSDNKIITNNYISYDLGFNWVQAPELMQPTDKFPALYGAQAFIVNQEQNSRAVKPITEWDTPFIYLYGGNKVDGKLSPTIYRGVIKKLEFKPLQ